MEEEIENPELFKFIGFDALNDEETKKDFREGNFNVYEHYKKNLSFERSMLIDIEKGIKKDLKLKLKI